MFISNEFLSNQTLSTIDFLYEDIEAPTKASMRFLKLEKIVSDFMSTCSGPEGPGHYRYGMWIIKSSGWVLSLDSIILFIVDNVRENRYHW